MRHTARWLRILAVTVVVVALAVAGARSTRRTSSAGTSAATAAVSGHDDQSTADGQMIVRHQQMTEQMRISDSPGMLSMMTADPMWEQMRTTSFIEQQNEHQREINIMLGLGG
jgi:hypothetical protein